MPLIASVELLRWAGQREKRSVAPRRRQALYLQLTAAAVTPGDPMNRVSL